MPKQRSQLENRAPIWGVFLLFVGVVFLLQTLNVIPWGLWGRLWRYWPVLIIIIGLALLLRHTNIWLLSLVTIILLFGCLGLAVWQYGPAPMGERAKSYNAPLDGVENAQVKVSFAAGNLLIGGLSANSPNLVEAVSNAGVDINASFQRQGTSGRLNLSPGQDRDISSGARWEVKLSQKIPMTMEIDSPASEAKIDLTELNITEFRLDANAGNYVVKLPVVSSRADMKSNLASLEITIPRELPARISADVDLGSIEVDESRFPRQGKYYVSPDFESASQRLELAVSVNLGRVQIK